jgi:hypothetical protein
MSPPSNPVRPAQLRVDITAKTSPDTPRDQVLLVTQAVLAERFHMELHREQQLGLHLESTRAPIDVIVIDRADRVPVAN